MEFLNWTMLGTFAGASAAVAILTEITKGIPFIKKIPTQIWSYILSVLVLIGAQAFNNDLSWANAVIDLINGALISLSANGGYEFLNRIFEKKD